MRRFKQIFFDHPLIKSISFGLLGLLGNLLSGAYIFEITKSVGSDQILDWSASSSSRAFWFLLGVLVVMGLYGWGVARNEVRVRESLHEKDVLGIALSELMTPLIDAAKKDIAEGKIRTLEDVKAMFSPLGGK